MSASFDTDTHQNNLTTLLDTENKSGDFTADNSLVEFLQV